MYREKDDQNLPVRELQHPCLTKWRSRIDWAEQNGGFHADHKQAAERWDRCAVGEARQLYGIKCIRGRAEFGPADKRLYDLGARFNTAVASNNFAWANRLLTAIEQRLAELA